MRRLVYQVAVGPPSRLYEHCIASVADYCEAHNIEHFVQRAPILRIQPDPETSGRSEGASRLGYLPIFEKENAFEFFYDYDQVAIIDADVWIRPGSPNVFDVLRPGDDFAGVVEREAPITDAYRQKIRRYSKGQYGTLDDVNWQWDNSGAAFINMGVMVMNCSLARFLRGQTPAEFLARPEFKRFVDGVGHWKWSTDQTLLNWWLRSEGARVQPMDWRWNALYGALQPGKIQEAFFVHFFLKTYLPDHGEAVDELMEAVR